MFIGEKTAARTYQFTPGVRKRLMCLCRRTWFWEFPLQKFWRNVCARVMTSFIFSSFCGRTQTCRHEWVGGLGWGVVGVISDERLAADVFARYKPSRRGSAADPAPRCGRPCSLAASAAASDSSYWGNTAYWGEAGSKHQTQASVKDWKQKN